LAIVMVISLAYYWFSTDHTRDPVLIGTVDSNEVIVSPQIHGRIQKVRVDDAAHVRAGALIAILDTSELKPVAPAATGTISTLTAQQASVQARKDQVNAAQADLEAPVARTHQASAAQSTVASTRGQLANAEAQMKEAEVRLGYTKICAPVTGTVSVRAAREGE